MPRKRLKRVLKECEREGCHNTFYVKVGAKYQKRYCSSRCAALATAKSRKRRKPRRIRGPVDRLSKEPMSITLSELQELPVNFDDPEGGKFAEMLLKILRGELVLIGL